MKNIVTILLALTFAFGAYYLYAQNKNATLEIGEDTVVTDTILMNTQLFIEHRAVLDSVKLNTSVFENQVFLSYQNFTQPLPRQLIGRENPFVKTTGGQ